MNTSANKLIFPLLPGIARSLLLVLLAIMTSGCATRPQIKDQIGIGAIAAEHVGKTRQMIEIRPGAGQGIGYLIADEADRAHAQALTKSTVRNNYSHGELGALTNTRWRVRSFTPAQAGGANLDMTVTFRPSGHVVTRTTMPDSTTRLVTERYRVVGDTLIINNNDYVLNAQFRVRGETLTIGAGGFLGVLERIRSRDGL